MPDALAGIWRETRRLAEVNSQRLTGRTPRGEVAGYGGHPDYAQVGRIRENIELIRRMTPSTHPVSSNASASSGAGSDLLGW
jgi:hypothetical protein